MTEKNIPLPDLRDLLGDSSSDKNSISPKNSNKENIGMEKEVIPSLEKKEEGMSLDDLFSQSQTEKISSTPSMKITKKIKNQESKDENLFHNAFNKSASDDKELLDQIDEYDDHTKLHLQDLEKKEEDPFLLLKKKEEESFKKLESRFRKFLITAQAFVFFSILFSITSFVVFSLFLNTPSNGIFGDVVESNYGIVLEKKEEEHNALVDEEREIKKEIKKVQAVIDGFENNTVLASILEKRVNWISIIQEINGVRCYADPDGDINQCMNGLLRNTAPFNPFIFESYTTKGGENNEIQVIVSGKVHGSQGYIFQKIARLIEAFNDNKYFSGAETRSFTKNTDSRLGYVMPFTMKLLYSKEIGEEKEE